MWFSSWIDVSSETDLVQDERRDLKLSPTLVGMGVGFLHSVLLGYGVDLKCGINVDDDSTLGEESLFEPLFEGGLTTGTAWIGAQLKRF